MSDTITRTPSEVFDKAAGDLMSDPYREVSVVFINRYSTDDKWGIHVLSHNPHAPVAAFRHVTIGLFGLEDGGKITDHITDFWPTSVDVHYADLKDRSFQEYRTIRDLVIPLEWKSWTDHELAQRIIILKRGA